jgi:AcrR family transcriptional regulator
MASRRVGTSNWKDDPVAEMRDAAGAPSGRKKFSQEKWRQILAASAETFAAKGYEATTIRDIAESVGMLGGSLYYYIDTKEDLLYALIDDFHRVGMEEVAAAEAEVIEAGQGDQPLAVLRAVCARHAEVNAHSRVLSAVFYNDFRHLGDERKQHIVESRRRHQHRIEQLVGECQKAGLIRRDLDPHRTALAMLAMLNSPSSWHHVEKDRSTPGVGEFLSTLLIDGLAVRPGNERRPAKQAAARKSATKPATRKAAASAAASPVVPLPARAKNRSKT